MANYLITGGAGFIGSNLVEYLVEQGESVRVLDSLVTGKRANLASVEKRIEILEGDLRDPDACRAAVEDMDYVLHQGALPSVPRSIDHPIESTTINVLGTVQLLDASVRQRVKRFIMAASSSAYGNQVEEKKVESLLPSPLSPYAAGKLAAEFFCRAFHEVHGLETICLRYFNVFGPRQDPNSPYSAVVPRFITTMLQGRAPVIYGDGLQSRDFTFVENIIRANVLAVRAPISAAGKVFNIAAGNSYTLVDLAREINQILGTSIAPNHEPAKPGDVRHSLADISSAKTEIGYEVAVDFAEGLRRTVEWYRSQ